MARRKSNTQAREQVNEIPPTTIKLGWGDRRTSQSNGAGLYVYYGKGFIYQTFDTLCTARHFIDLMIDGDEYTWEVWSPAKGISPEPMIKTARGLTIRGAGLENAMEYEFQSAAEREFVFPAPYDQMYRVFPQKGPEEDDIAPPPAPEPVWDAATHTLIKPAKPARVTKPKAEPKPKVDKTGLVLVADIAKKHGWDAKHVRAALRKAKVEKPAVGWAFPQSEVERITKTIKENLK